MGMPTALYSWRWRMLDFAFCGVLTVHAIKHLPSPKAYGLLLAAFGMLCLAITHFVTQDAALRRITHRFLMALLLAGTLFALRSLATGELDEQTRRITLVLCATGLGALVNRWFRRGGWRGQP